MKCSMMRLLERLWRDFSGRPGITGCRIPKHAFVLSGDMECWVETDRVRSGDTLLIYPGECIPVDGIIIEGQSLLETAENQGVEAVCRGIGDKVYSGSLNRANCLKIQAIRPAAKSFFQKHLAKVAAREASKARAALLLPYYRADDIGSIFPGDIFM